MKDTFSDANFPRTPDGRIYHVGVRQGEVANRIVTVGDPSRARKIAKALDETPTHFVLKSERGFLTITGAYKGVPVSVVSIGMGLANMDFFVRECRECVDGDMAIIRLGSCGGLVDDLPVGSLSIPRAAVSITRNYDYDFTAPHTSAEDYNAPNPPYRISRAVWCHQGLHAALKSKVEELRPEMLKEVVIREDFVNASADGFYASQGRKTTFPDHNGGLISALLAKVDGVATLEMETHHLFHLSSIYSSKTARIAGEDPSLFHTVLTEDGPQFSVDGDAGSEGVGIVPKRHDTAQSPGVIYAAAIQMVFAERRSQRFITPEEVEARESWAGRACLEALVDCRM